MLRKLKKCIKKRGSEIARSVIIADKCINVYLKSKVIIWLYRGIYFPFCAPKGGGKVFKSGYAREEFLVARSATKNSSLDYFSGKTLPQESLMKGMKEILNFLPKEFQRKKYLTFFQKMLVVKKW